MASSRIKGITVEIGGDTTGLDKALKGINKNITDTKRDLKDVERLLKLDPTNTELLRQKQELLGKEVKQTSEKLDALKDAEKQLQVQVKEGKASQEQYDALKREIIATANELEELEKAASKSNATLSKISAVADNMADKTGKLADKTKTLSVGAAGLLSAATGAAVAAGLAADDLNTLSKQSGFSTEQLQTWQYGADRVDVAVSDIVSANQKLKKNMASTSKDVQKAFEDLGISVMDSNGEFRNSTDVFNDAVKALSLVQNETERDVLAMTLFGKSADSLAGIIDDGGQAFREYGQEAKDAGLILSQEALDSANEFNDAIDKLKAQSAGTFAEVGTEIATMLIPFMEDAGNMISNLLEAIRGLDEGQLKTIGTILLVVASISPLLSVISKVSSGISLVSQGIGFLISNPIVLLIAAIVALVALIATKGDEIQDILRKVDDFMQNIFATDFTNIFGPVLGEALNAFFANIKNIWDSIKLVLNGIIDFIRGVFTGDWSRAWNGIKQILSGIVGGFVSIVAAPINGIIGLLNMAIGAINTMIKGLNSIGFDLPKWLGGGSWHPSIPSIPKIAYLAGGGILNEGTAVVGEAGPEILTVTGGKTIVQPLTGSAAAGQGLGELMGLLNMYLPYLATGNQIILDTGVLVGETAPMYNEALGEIAEEEKYK